jgi:hypothetical protein
MTRKHFRALAEALSEAKPVPFLTVPSDSDAASLAMWSHLVDEIADVCSETNPRFDYGAFRAAAGQR